MSCDFNIMSIEWQMISDFSQAQMNDLKDFLDDAISIAIEIAFVEQTRMIERTINEIINVCFDLASAHVSVSASLAFSRSADWKSITHNQEQSAFESISELKRSTLLFNLNDSASSAISILSASSSATVSSSSFAIAKSTIISSSRSRFRSALKSALIARLTAYDCSLSSRCASFVSFFWRVVRSLYHDLVKQELD